jgi:hypothetical protein
MSKVVTVGVTALLDQNGNADGLGHQLVQNCQSLRGQLIREKIDPRQVSARPGEAGDKTELDRVFTDAEDDWGRRCCSFGRLRRHIAGCGDDSHLAAHQIRHQGREAIVLAFQPVVFDRYVLTINVGVLAEAFAKRGRKAGVAISRPISDKPDNRHCCLLRASCDWPRSGGGAEKRYELAPSHCHPRVSDRAIVSDYGTALEGGHLRSGSKADICAAKGHVCCNPNSDRFRISAFAVSRGTRRTRRQDWTSRALTIC